MLITHTHMYIYIGGERGVHMTKTWHLKIIKGNCSRQQHASRELLYWIDLRICCFCFRIGGSITLSAKLVLACLCLTAIGPVQVIRTLMQFVYFPTPIPCAETGPIQVYSFVLGYCPPYEVVPPKWCLLVSPQYLFQQIYHKHPPWLKPMEWNNPGSFHKKPMVIHRIQLVFCVKLC